MKKNKGVEGPTGVEGPRGIRISDNNIEKISEELSRLEQDLENKKHIYSFLKEICYFTIGLLLTVLVSYVLYCLYKFLFI